MTGAAATALVAVEPGMRIAAMVEHAIEDQTHFLFLRMVAQAQQRRIAAKLRINATIILGIIFMHAGATNTGFRYSAVTPSCFRYGSRSLIPSRSPP